MQSTTVLSIKEPEHIYKGAKLQTVMLAGAITPTWVAVFFISIKCGLVMFWQMTLGLTGHKLIIHL